MDTDIEAEVEERRFKNLLFACLPTKREMTRLTSRSEARATLGVAMEGLNYQLDYIRRVNNNKLNLTLSH